ncbi:MAG: hypothetical protein Q7O66_21390 [Dehalococcoidia bacterium]|nr:hypothetical protein [Dehalococcoidia bacterium]
MSNIVATRPTKSVLTLLERRQELTFPVVVLGQSQAPIFPMQVGPWWMEPLTRETKLPARAEKRLQALLATGVKAKAVVLFHEIPTATKRRPSRLERNLRQAVSTSVRSLQQELPVKVEQAGRAANQLFYRTATATQKNAPVVARSLLKMGVVALPIIAAVVLGTLSITATIAAAALHDPCLVLVTQDGYWIEVDRWDD